MGMAMMGTGEGSGENRALEAAEKAISSPLLEDVSIKGARGILINVTASPDVTLQEVNEAAELVHSEAHEEANIIWGMVIDPTREDSVRVTVIATGFGDEREVAFTDRGVSLGVRGGRGQLGNMGNTGHNSGHTGNPYLPSSNAPQPVTIQNQYQEPEMARAENDMGNIDAPSYTRKPNAPVVKLNRLNVVGDEKVDGGYAEEIPPFLRRS
jgi:cell division GTPase FtsZ